MSASPHITPTLSDLDVGYGCFVDAEHTCDFQSAYAFTDQRLDFDDLLSVQCGIGFGSLGLEDFSALGLINGPRLGPSRNVVSDCANLYAVFGGNFLSRDAGEVIFDNPKVHGLSDNLVSVPELVGAVSHVVHPRSGAQVGGIDAGGVIAGVKDVLAAFNGSVGAFIAKAVSKLLVLISEASAAKLAVSFIVSAGGPLPASTGRVLVDLAPKSFIKHMHLHGALRRVVAG